LALVGTELLAAFASTSAEELSSRKKADTQIGRSCSGKAKKPETPTSQHHLTKKWQKSEKHESKQAIVSDIHDGGFEH
jgi:hypothetical protein